MFIYCICTQYLVGAPFALITASIQHGMEVIRWWHCWGGMEAQVSLTVAFRSSAFFGLLFLIFLLTIPHRFSMGFRSGEFAGQSSTPTPWSFNQLLVLLAVWAGKTPLTLSVVQEWLNKRNTTTVAKFLDTSVCGGSWCLDRSLSPFLVKFTQILESILLDNPHKAAVLSVGCASFSSTLFPSTQLSVNMLGYSTLNSQLLWQWMFVAYPPCEGCQWLRLHGHQ